MNRRFRLATVERLRAAALDDAARALAAARREVGDALARQETLAAELAGCVAAPDADVSGLEAAVARRGLLREQLDAAAADVTRAQQQVTDAVARWTAARAGLKAVEVLHDRHREALRAELLRREQRQLDDLAGSRRRSPVGASSDPAGSGDSCEEVA